MPEQGPVHGRNLLHDLGDVHGVGPGLAKAFAGIGIRSCEELLAVAGRGSTAGVADAVEGVSAEGLKRSIGPRHQAGSRTSGRAGRAGGTKAQCWL